MHKVINGGDYINLHILTQLFFRIDDGSGDGSGDDSGGTDDGSGDGSTSTTDDSATTTTSYNNGQYTPGRIQVFLYKKKKTKLFILNGRYNYNRHHHNGLY